MIRRCWLLAFPLTLAAHMVSMSSGELKIEGNRAHYELRIPMYEVAHVREPEHTLIEHVRFKSGLTWVKPLHSSCGEQQGTYVCTADYEFPSAVEALEVECTLAKVTVPNHIHLLHAYRGDKSDQEVFDLSFTTAEVHFRPPTAFETATRESISGFMRAAAGLAPLLFLASLVLAARGRRELLTLTAAFAVSEAFACAVVPRISFSLSPRFIEAAAALTVAYLAFEIILLPDSKHRWLVVGVLGLFHGAYFSAFLVESHYHLVTFLAGVVAAELVLVCVFAAIFTALSRIRVLHRAVPVAASLLLVTGLVWFFFRLRA